MSRSLGFIGLIIVMAVGAFIYMRQIQSATPSAAEGGGNPHSTIDIAGVKNDLLSIAQAERAHMASAGKYVSLDELVSAGELNAVKTNRPHWTYNTNISDTGFKIYAIYSGDTSAGKPPRLSIDETMQVTAE